MGPEAAPVRRNDWPAQLDRLQRRVVEFEPLTKRLDISRDIAAPPELAHAAISDVTRMGDWSEECHACEWHEGFDGPVVGATFDGHNRYGEHEWTTQGKVIEAHPGRVFAFECSMMDFHYSTWGHRIERTESGCRPSGTMISDPSPSWN